MMLERRTLLKSGSALMALAATPALAQDSKGGGKPLSGLFDSFVRENLDASPLTVSSLGMDTGERAWQKSLWDDASPAAIAEAKERAKSQLQLLSAVRRAGLKGDDLISYDVVLYGLKTQADGARFPYGPGVTGQPYILSQLTGSYSQGPSFLDNQHSIETRADADAYLARLDGFGRLMDQEIDVQRHDAAQGVFAPDFALAKTLSQMKDLRAPKPEDSPLTESLVRRAKEKNIPGAWGTWAARLVEEKVYPALERQIALVELLQQRATHDAGVWRLPDGEAYYRASLKQWATTDQSPQEIHQIGLDIVKDHSARIDALMRRNGLTKGTVGARLKAMYADARYRYPDTDAAKEQLIADLNRKVQEIRGRLKSTFGVLPKADLQIKRVPKNIEAAQPGGYYNNPSLDGKRPGIYWINLRDTAEIPKWTLPTLTYHEGIPGHHLQLSIQQEAGLPLIRKLAFYSAYIEGWALYAEQLAVEMGEYKDDPLGQIGQLHDAMFRGVRLVVDSGMHAMKWSRERAVKYYVDTLGDKEASAVTEIERYCVWPGQACTYMLGKLAFLKERDRAKAALGARFDIRKFHDAVLTAGAVPLDVLDGITDRYVAEAKAG
jgi:uncharacterized protein (DUF885 family)